MNHDESKIFIPDGKTLTSEEAAHVTGGVDSSDFFIVWECHDCGMLGGSNDGIRPTECEFCHSINITVTVKYPAGIGD